MSGCCRNAQFTILVRGDGPQADSGAGPLMDIHHIHMPLRQRCSKTMGVFPTVVALALTVVMVGVGPACAEPREGLSESPRSSNPDERAEPNHDAPPSVMDPGMQHLQRGQPDSRASVAPPNRDPSMSTNPDRARPSPESGNATTEKARERQERY